MIKAAIKPQTKSKKNKFITLEELDKEYWKGVLKKFNEMFPCEEKDVVK